jgi:uncharacterized OB-fold protein
MSAEQRKIPAPTVDPETKPFWDAICEGRLMIKSCNACGESHYYPRTICPHCGSDDTVFKETTGKGTIYSFSPMRRVPTPYTVAYVTLEGEEISMLTNIVDCDPDDLKIGQEVKLVFTETEGDGPPVPTFAPV